MRLCVRAFFAVIVTVVPALSAAQTPASQTVPPQTLTLDQAMQYAVDHYPTVRAALEQVNASMAGVDIARSAYLPRLDSLWQSNRATANNILGQVLPQSVIPSLSGPVLPSASAESVWGSATASSRSRTHRVCWLRRKCRISSPELTCGARSSRRPSPTVTWHRFSISFGNRRGIVLCGSLVLRSADQSPFLSR